MKRSISLLLVFSVLGSGITPLSQSRATEGPDKPTFIERVKNTKEATSILLRREDTNSFEEEFPEMATVIREKVSLAFAALASSMEPEDTAAPEACEPLILNRLQKEMRNRGIPSTTASVRYGLSVLREKNLIDDVTLLPLLSAYSAWEILGYDEKEWVKKDREGRTAILPCPTEQELAVAQSVREEKGRKMKRRHLVDRIEKMESERKETDPRYLPVQIAWLKELSKSKYDVESPFSLPEVLERVATVKNSSIGIDFKDTPTEIMSKKKKKTGGLSNRLALYKKYNAYQISTLSDTYEKFTERMSAASVELRIKYSDGREDEVYQLKPEEQYRMAAKMLHKEIEELKLEKPFAGKNPTFDEMLIASLETGLIPAEKLDRVLAIDDLWNPDMPSWQKTWNIVKKISTVGRIFIPPPGNTIASLAVALVEIFMKKKADNKLATADDRGISIF